MNKLTYHDLQFALMRCPKSLLQVMKRPEWAGKIFVGGGFLRSIVAGEPVNDVDVFVQSKSDGYKLAHELNAIKFGLDKKTPDTWTAEDCKKLNLVYTTGNAYTLLNFKPTIQIIHRWVFLRPEDVALSFDFTNCCAVVWRGAGTESPANTWRSYCDDRFYCDIAARRLVYRRPVRNEDAGGSMLRVLKYYAKGYRIPLDSLGAVMARMFMGLDLDRLRSCDGTKEFSEAKLGSVLTGLLREVDPAIDPSHVAHLPAEEVSVGNGHSGFADADLAEPRGDSHNIQQLPKSDPAWVKEGFPQVVEDDPAFEPEAVVEEFKNSPEAVVEDDPAFEPEAELQPASGAAVHASHVAESSSGKPEERDKHDAANLLHNKAAEMRDTAAKTNPGVGHEATAKWHRSEAEKHAQAFSKLK